MQLICVLFPFIVPQSINAIDLSLCHQAVSWQEGASLHVPHPKEEGTYMHSDKKKLNEPRECLFKGMLNKVLVEK